MEASIIYHTLLLDYTDRISCITFFDETRTRTLQHGTGLPLLIWVIVKLPLPLLGFPVHLALLAIIPRIRGITSPSGFLLVTLGCFLFLFAPVLPFI